MNREEIKILLIEDEDAHAEIIQRAFEEEAASYLIARVGSLAAAKKMLVSEKIALVIADWRLPDGESMELLGAFAVPVILMTSYGNERIAVAALKSGALDYVVKSPESMMDMPHLAERAMQQWEARAERMRMQQALAESESQFRLLAENSTDMISRLARDGRFLYVSPACRFILGFSAADLQGRHFFRFIHRADLPQVKYLFEQPEDKVYVIVHRALRRAGDFIWLESSARPIFDATGKVTEIQVASRDITERKKSEQALHEAHQSLEDAYQKTIEGWVRALDLRDRETEGHTQRVTELTVQVARMLGFSDAELICIRQGALLHDMGKMAIPDDILHKPGPLTEEEWAKMRQHPAHAYDMLAPIAYLKPALEIPFCHHERWDGSGYPRGLKGEEIPLTARLFAIVDVWDALLSDRPYRKALPREEVEKYLREKAGHLFDSQLVQRFLQMIDMGVNLPPGAA